MRAFFGTELNELNVFPLLFFDALLNILSLIKLIRQNARCARWFS